MRWKGVLKWIGIAIAVYMAFAILLAIFFGDPDERVTQSSPSQSVYTPIPTPIRFPTRTPTPMPTAITYSAANLATHTAVVATRQANAGTVRAIRISEAATSECLDWFKDFDKYHLLNVADLETIADMMNPQGSFYHYGSKSEVQNAVHYHARAIRDRARVISTTFPDDMSDDIRLPKERYANAYYDFAELLLRNFDGNIGQTHWVNSFLRSIKDIEEVNSSARRAVSNGRRYC